MKKNDTIYALSTALGKSALAVIRISGPDALKKTKKISTNMPEAPRIATLNKIKNTNKEIIDETLTTLFKGPNSYTGEDLVEISAHGGNAIIKKISEILNNEGARPALPGEFTRRAFENNKLDLTRVEAIADLVNAETEMQRKQAISNLSGFFFKKNRKIFSDLKKSMANIEAVIDFSDEDLPSLLIKQTKEQTKNIITRIEELIINSSSGISIKDGFLVSVVGGPNTGKSSFVNYLSDKDVAIVTNIPGTTRDTIETFLDIGGYPVKLVDTAGIRKSNDVVEKIGIEKAIEISKESDVNIIFIDKKKDIKKFINKDIDNVCVVSKQDLTLKNFEDDGFFNISSLTGFGINKILIKIQKAIENKAPKEKSFISRERHIICLTKTIFHLKKSQKPKNIDLFAEDLRLATKEMSKLYGGIDIEEILDIVFSDFCIGK